MLLTTLSYVLLHTDFQSSSDTVADLIPAMLIHMGQSAMVMLAFFTCRRGVLR